MLAGGGRGNIQGTNRNRSQDLKIDKEHFEHLLQNMGHMEQKTYVI